MSERKHYLDNIRWITVCIVIIYHIIYMFNNSGVISNINVKGIPVMDSFLIFVYPWFMCLLFIVSGISSRYSLQKRSGKQFIKDRTQRILVPSICGIFAYGWISGLISDKCAGIFADSGDSIPGFLKYIIYSLIGLGPLWFAHVVFLASVLLLLIRAIDKNDKLWNACGKTNYIVLALLTIAVWLSSLILNTPLITVYRFGIYFFMFFLGYFVFSHDEVIEKLKKIAVPMGIIAFVVGIVYTITHYGTVYADNAVLNTPFTCIYLWIAVLAILGLGAKFLNFRNRFTEYMTANNFSFYVLHYAIEVSIGYALVTYLNLPFALNYILILIGTVILLPILTEILKRIPIVRLLILGIVKKKNNSSKAPSIQ